MPIPTVNGASQVFGAKKRKQLQDETRLHCRLHAFVSCHPLLTSHFILLKGVETMYRTTNPPRFRWQGPTAKPHTQPRPIGPDPGLDQG
jgi:hypothetical protein